MPSNERQTFFSSLRYRKRILLHSHRETHPITPREALMACTTFDLLLSCFRAFELARPMMCPYQPEGCSASKSDDCNEYCSTEIHPSREAYSCKCLENGDGEGQCFACTAGHKFESEESGRCVDDLTCDEKCNQNYCADGKGVCKCISTLGGPQCVSCPPGKKFESEESRRCVDDLTSPPLCPLEDVSEQMDKHLAQKFPSSQYSYAADDYAFKPENSKCLVSANFICPTNENKEARWISFCCKGNKKGTKSVWNFKGDPAQDPNKVKCALGQRTFGHYSLP